MTLGFEDFSIDHIGGILTVDDNKFAWVRGCISLTDPSTTAHPMIHFEVPVQYEVNWTVEQVRQAAFDKALDALQVAVGLLQKHGLDGMGKLATDFEPT